MFRLWGKIFKDNHMLRDTVIEDDRNDTRTQTDLARFQYSGIQTPQQNSFLPG